ncbi:MAG: thioredoxin family protein [Aquabacterium sp.]
MPAPSPVLDIVCLCAAWCGTCREYGPTFKQLQQALPAHRYRWIDIEDEADFVGDVDVETFPTLLVAHEGRVLFAGPVLPRLTDAQRLVDVQAGLAAQGQWPADAALGLAPDQAVAFAALARALSPA